MVLLCRFSNLNRWSRHWSCLADTFAHQFNLQGATEIAIACATFGLVFGGIIGGPVARFLLNRQKQGENPENDEVDDIQEAFEHPTYKRKITARSLIGNNCNDFSMFINWSIFRCTNKRYCTPITNFRMVFIHWCYCPQYFNQHFPFPSSRIRY